MLINILTGNRTSSMSNISPVQSHPVPSRFLACLKPVVNTHLTLFPPQPPYLWHLVWFYWRIPMSVTPQQRDKWRKWSKNQNKRMPRTVEEGVHVYALSLVQWKWCVVVLRLLIFGQLSYYHPHHLPFRPITGIHSIHNILPNGHEIKSSAPPGPHR